MNRKVYVEAKVRLILHIDESVSVGDVMDKLQITIDDLNDSTLEEFDVVDYDVTDSK